MTTTERRTSRKLTAVLAGGAVLGIGAVTTLATWNDSEWVNGLFVTSSFEVEQNIVAPFSEESDWTNAETNPGQTLSFSLNADALTPGNTAYGTVALRTAAGSEAAVVTLQGAVEASGQTSGTELWNALEVTVTTSSTEPTCDDTATEGDVIASGNLAAVGESTQTQNLAANSGSTQYYCFAVTLPASYASDTSVQGQQATPAWEFAATSA